ALNEAQSLAFERMDEVSSLTARLEVMNAELSNAQSLASMKHDEILTLSALVKAKTAAADEAHRVATERQDEIVELQAQLADVRRELQTLEDTKTVRTLRGLGLLKPRK
ncbi:MAG TPA: hypothetical protein PK231_07845, partial [Acidocella sp.]|nr:hypothetical protein [Acidocella sp.]